ncbi:MAG: peptidylprolyl isomerase [Legionellales bacterium]|mgnify:FL=1|nr:peptidylprolyl isomerase [Legionellales bacterium]HAV93682.1 peptidylprolyl isomerase [Pseudomonadota bacterium]|tara:strand:- start:73 stop:501 length:429 start_codon:yes stop_codon:yes gene_type:complete
MKLLYVILLFVTGVVFVSEPLAATVFDQVEFKSTKSGLQLYDVASGHGVTAQPGDVVSVHYVGKLADGSEFDSSRKRHQPFVFILGQGQVIPGWDEGVAGMKVGGVRQLIIPPELAYGSRDLGEIPSNSTLYFEVELTAITQ